ncbi:MAG: hypothetical protein M3R69_00950 [Acidobacteriota bacterium]|nr:hypothetical protein [Acidobacteriota bacterium]
MTTKQTSAFTNGDAPGIVPMDLEKLILDNENPRLASGKAATSPEEVLRVLWREMAVEEVAVSIAANGFFPEENLFVIPENSKEKDERKRKYIVVEGNRRLAAVLLLRDEALREANKATDLPKISAAAKKALAKLPVSIYPNRKSLWEYFGFRHINGPKPWDSFSKAKYVADVFEHYKIPLDEIARKIGDQRAVVKKLYRGYAVLKQAEEQGGFNKEDRIRNKFYFSHLYTATDQIAFQDFLGIKSERSLKPNPIPKSKLAELSLLMIWLYGSKAQKKEPVVKTQNPDLNILREVISKPRALAALKAGISLDRAREIAIGDEERLREALTRAKEDLIEASGAVTLGYKGDKDLFEVMKEILLLTESISDAMQKKLK